MSTPAAATNAGCASSHCKVQTHHSLFVKSTLRSTEPCTYHLCATTRDASRRGLKHAYHPVLESRASRACRFLASAGGHSPMSPPSIPFARNYCSPHISPHACAQILGAQCLCTGHLAEACRRYGLQSAQIAALSGRAAAIPPELAPLWPSYDSYPRVTYYASDTYGGLQQNQRQQHGM
jgi:hypothetical protein